MRSPTQIQESVSPQQAVEFLNQLLAVDQGTITSLVNNRIKCNDDLADHPTVQVRADGTVGLLGILNGLFGVYPDGYGCIVAEYSEDESKIQRFIYRSQKDWEDSRKSENTQYPPSDKI